MQELVREATTFVVTLHVLFRPIVDRGSEQAKIGVVQTIGHCVNVSVIVVHLDDDAGAMLAKATKDAIIRVESLLITRVGRLDIAASDHLLCLFLAEHELGGCQESAYGNFAELLLLQELRNVHAHSELLVPLRHLAYKVHALAADDVPAGRLGDAIARAEFGFDLEV